LRPRAGERLDLADQLGAADGRGRARVIAVLAVEALAGQRGHELNQAIVCW
jgi:hypothetical protein